MARIVAGLFETQVGAESAIARLRAQGLQDREITTFIVSPPGMHQGLPLGGDEAADSEAKGAEGGALRGAAIGAAAGAVAGIALTPLVGPLGIAAGLGAGAYAGSLSGAGSAMGDENKTEPTARPGGVMVAVNAEGRDDSPLVEALRGEGAKLVEIAQGQWTDGKWVDFDPVSPPTNVVVAVGNPNYPT